MFSSLGYRGSLEADLLWNFIKLWFPLNISPPGWHLVTQICSQFVTSPPHCLSTNHRLEWFCVNQSDDSIYLYDRHGQNSSCNHSHCCPRIIVPVEDRIDELVAGEGDAVVWVGRGCGGGCVQHLWSTVASPCSSSCPVNQWEAHVPQPWQRWRSCSKLILFKYSL